MFIGSRILQKAKSAVVNYHDMPTWRLVIFLNKLGVVCKMNNEPLGAKGPPMVGEEVRKKDIGKVGS
jgi:hypothetical protein